MRDSVFQLLVGAAAPTNQLRGAAADPVGGGAVLQRLRQPAVIGETKVIIAGKVDKRAALGADERPLRGRDGASGTEPARGLDPVQPLRQTNKDRPVTGGTSSVLRRVRFPGGVALVGAQPQPFEQ